VISLRANLQIIRSSDSCTTNFYTWKQGRIQPVCLGEYGVTTVREMKYTSQHCCDKTMYGKMGLYRECCFPNCTKSWGKNCFCRFFLGAIAQIALHPPLPGRHHSARRSVGRWRVTIVFRT